MRRWKGSEPGQLTPTDQRDISYHMVSGLAIKLGELNGDSAVVWELTLHHRACTKLSVVVLFFSLLFLYFS